MRMPGPGWALALALMIAWMPACQTGGTGFPPAEPRTEGVSAAVPTEDASVSAAAGPKPAATGQGRLSIVLEGSAGPVPSEIPARLAVAALDSTGAAMHDVEFTTRVKNEAGAVVYATTGLRERSGVHRFWLGPLEPGKYSLDAIASGTGDTSEPDSFTGTLAGSLDFEARPAGFVQPAELSLSVEGAPRAGAPAKISFAVKSAPDGKAILRSDNYLQIRRDGLLVFRTGDIEASTGSQSFQYSFPEPGRYQVTLSSFPAPGRVSVPFAPLAKTISVEVAPGATAGSTSARGAATKPTEVPSERPRVVVDVEPPIGPVPAELPTRIRVSALDGTLLPIGQVDFDVAVTDGSGGVVYSATGVRAPLGTHELWVGPLRSGFYRVKAKASPTAETVKRQADAIRNGLSAERSFEALPAGLVEPAELSLSVEGVPRARALAKITFGLVGAGDHRPILESDNYLAIYRDGLLVYQASNLHSRTALQTVDYTFAEPGSYTLSLTAAPTPMRASLPFMRVARTLSVTVEPDLASQRRPTAVPVGQAAPPPTTAPPSPTAVPAKPTATPRPAPPPLAEFTVRVKDLQFTPNVLEVARGTRVSLLFENSSVMPHSLSIPALAAEIPIIDGGQQARREFLVERPGEYQFVCSVLGHREAGMVGKLVVK